MIKDKIKQIKLSRLSSKERYFITDILLLMEEKNFTDFYDKAYYINDKIILNYSSEFKLLCIYYYTIYYETHLYLLDEPMKIFIVDMVQKYLNLDVKNAVVVNLERKF